MIVYLTQDIPPFVMYCIYGESGSSLLIESTDSMILTCFDHPSPTVKRILKVLKKAGFTYAAWWELGLQLKLGLDKHAIEKDNSTAYECLLETIELWLRNGEDPSWEALADAVCECEHGGINVAARIRREIGLGELKKLTTEGHEQCYKKEKETEIEKH